MLSDQKNILRTIQPRVKSYTFLKSLAQMQIPDDQMPYTKPFVADILISYAFDLPDQFITISHSDMNNFYLNPDQIHELALENLARDIEKVQVSAKGPVSYLETGGTMEATALLLPNVWHEIAETFPGDLVAAAPMRDAVLLAGTEDTEGMKFIRMLLDSGYDPNETHAISGQLLYWNKGDWEPFQN